MSLLVFLMLTASLLGTAQAQEQPQSEADKFDVRSTTFQDWNSAVAEGLDFRGAVNAAQVPLVMVNNVIVDGVNSCAPDFRPGGNQSPQLSWTGARPGTASFAVEMSDADAHPGCVGEYWSHHPTRNIKCGSYHWGIYNISAKLTELPQNAGVAGSKYGRQAVNDFSHARYDGPCQRPKRGPFTHRYTITVYDLDITLDLPPSATVKALDQALMKAFEDGHVLATATIVAFYPTAQ